MLEQLESQFVLMQQHQVCIEFISPKIFSISSIFIDWNIILERVLAHFCFLSVFVEVNNLCFLKN